MHAVSLLAGGCGLCEARIKAEAYPLGRAYRYLHVRPSHWARHSVPLCPPRWCIGHHETGQ